MQIAWTNEWNDFKGLFDWCRRQILSRSSEDLAELSGVVALTPAHPYDTPSSEKS